MMFLLMSCAISTPQPPVRIAELLISPVDMPQGWGLLEISDSYLGDQGQIEGAYAIFFYFQPGYLLRAEEDILRYQDSSSAEWHYERFKQLHFNDDQVNLLTSWEKPLGFELENEAAEQWHFACASSTFHPFMDSIDSHTQCIFLAQYKEYLVIFNTTTIVDEIEFVQISDLTQTIKKLDTKMLSVTD
jgi:hypothetical protein